MNDRIFVVFNPHAGKGRGAQFVTPVLEALSAGGGEVSHGLTQAPGDEARLARVAGSPVLATELPVSAATYVTRNPESGRLRLLVSASAGEESLPTSPAIAGTICTALAADPTTNTRLPASSTSW